MWLSNILHYIIYIIYYMWLALPFEKVPSQGKQITCCVIRDRKAVSVEVIICKELSISD